MGAIDGFINNLASVIHQKRKDDEDEKKKRDKDRTVFNEDEFKPKEKSIGEKAMDFAGKAVDYTTKNGGVQNALVSKFLEESGKLAQKLPDTTIRTKPVEDSKYKDRPAMGMQREKTEGYDRYQIDGTPLQVSEFSGKTLPLISSLPGEIVRSYGKTAERLVTDKGREEIRQGVKDIPQLTRDIVQDPKKAVEAFNNPAIQAGLDVSDFLPGVGILSIGGEKLAKEAIEKGVKETAEKTAKKVSYSEASKLIERSGGFVKIHEAPLEAGNRYAADELARTLGLNPKYLYDQATDKRIDLREVLKNVDSQANVEGRIKVGQELMSSLSPSSSSSVIPESEFAKSSDETLRPNMNTSAGETVLPSSSLAANPPSTLNTNTLSPSNKYSPTASVDDVLGSESFITKYKSTTAEKPFLDTLLSDLAQDRQFTTNLKDPKTAASKIIRKLKKKPAYSEDSIGDFLRGNVVAKDSTDATSMLQQLTQKVKPESVEDYVNNPSPWGYQGINVNVKTPGGNLAEVQIHTPLSLKIQEALHPIYEKYRNEDIIPDAAYIESNRIAKEVSDKFNAENVAKTAKQELPLIDRPQVANAGIPDARLEDIMGSKGGKALELEQDIQRNNIKIQQEFLDGKITQPERNKLMQDNLNRSVAQQPKVDTPLIDNAARGVGQGAEDTTKLWEEEYLPKLNTLLKDAEKATPDEAVKIRSQIEDLEKEFSQRSDGIQKSFKERGFITSVKEEESLIDPIRKGVEGDYKVRANKELLSTAQKRIDDDPEGALEHVLHGGEVNDESVAMGIDLLRRFNNSGDTARAVDLVENLAPQLTEAGRTVQAASLLGRLTPEGALIYTQRIINKAAGAAKEKPKKITPQTAGEITDLAKKANEAIPGSRDQAVKTAQLAKRINQEVPPGWGQRISSLQTIMQLLNPKTFIRNLGGNVGFGGIESVKDIVATPLDMGVSLISGKRTKTIPNPITQTKGYVEGLKEGTSDALRGIDTTAQAGKFDTAKTPSFATKSEDNIIKKVIFKPLDFLERATNLTLKATDRASYRAAYDETLSQLTRLNKLDAPTDEMKELADMDGLYRTFQDKTIASEAFSRIKSGFNVGKSFGLGDFVLKYPKTPGNILARGIEYSPIGFFSSAVNLGKLVFGSQAGTIKAQKAFVESTARATTGSVALLGTGAILYQMGIITGKPDTDPDIKALEKTEGMGDYRLNASALKRFLLEGFDKEKAKPKTGDTILSYDWFQPQSIGFAMGADIEANKGINPMSLVGTLLGSMSSAANTLVEQPLVSGMSRLFNYGDLPGGVSQTIASAPSSFSPTLLNQVKQYLDNTSRDPDDPDLAKKGINLVKNRLPLLNRDLPTAYDSKGEAKETYQNDTNNFVNVFLNPAFVSKLENDNPEIQEVMRLFDETGEATQAPKQAEKTLKINGESKKLTAEEKQEYQQYIGVKTMKYFQQAMQKDTYKNMDDEEKVKALGNIITDVSMAAKVEIFGHKPKKPARKERVRKIMNMDDPMPLIAR